MTIICERARRLRAWRHQEGRPRQEEGSSRAGLRAGTHLLGDLLQVERAGRRDDDLLVNLHAGEGRHLGAGGNDDVLGLDRLLTAVVELNGDLRGRVERGKALLVGDGVLREEVLLDTAGQAVDGRVLVGEHLLEVDLEAVKLDALLGKGGLGLVVLVRRVEAVPQARREAVSLSGGLLLSTGARGSDVQGLRRDAADVEAGAAGRTTGVDAHRLEAELRRLDGGNVASRSWQIGRGMRSGSVLLAECLKGTRAIATSM
jgi:hypothetical protein